MLVFNVCLLLFFRETLEEKIDIEELIWEFQCYIFSLKYYTQIYIVEIENVY